MKCILLYIYLLTHYNYEEKQLIIWIFVTVEIDNIKSEKCTNYYIVGDWIDVLLFRGTSLQIKKKMNEIEQIISK